MAEVIANYPTAGKGAAAASLSADLPAVALAKAEALAKAAPAPTGHSPSQAHTIAEAQTKNIAEAQNKAQVVPAVGSGYLNEVSSLNVPHKPGETGVENREH